MKVACGAWHSAAVVELTNNVLWCSVMKVASGALCCITLRPEAYKLIMSSLRNSFTTISFTVPRVSVKSNRSLSLCNCIFKFFRDGSSWGVFKRFQCFQERLC